MSRYTEEEQARLVALPTVILLAVLVMSEADPVSALRDVIDRLDFIPEVKQAYPDNVLIEGMFADTEIPHVRYSSHPFRIKKQGGSNCVCISKK